MTAIEFQDGGHVPEEIVHFYSDELLVASTHRRVVVQRAHGGRKVIELPRTKFDAFGVSRLVRRALRLDKCNVFPLDPQGSSLILIRQGAAYKYDERNGLRQTLTLRQSRNVLHTDFCQTKSGRLLFGEYGANAERQPIPIYASDDNGESWHVAYQIPAGKAKHVHGVYADKYSDKVWIFTGDADGESWVIEASEDFSEVRYLGDGSQIYRACTVFFTPDKVVWAMDSPLQPSQTVHLDRRTGAVELHGSFPGPIWYGLEVPSSGYLSRQSPQAFERNSALLAARAPELSVRVLEDQPFYQDFAHSACFPQLQAALNVAGTGAGNFSSACDILRLQLLKRLGGLYLDADDRLLVTTASGQSHARLFDIPLRTTDDGLLLAPPVSNDQLGLYFKFNSSMIGSHPDNPTLDAVLDEMQARYADDASFYASRPDAQHDPVAFGAYARRLNRLTGPGLLNDVIDARLPWLRQLRELCVLMVAPVTDVHRMINLRWLNELLRLHLPLDRVAKIGHANSWRTVR